MRKEIWPCLLLLAAAAGCAENQITGKVLYEGKPVALGTVLFVGVDNAPRVALIEPDGSFLVRGVAPGQARIAVISLNPSQPLDPEFEKELRDKYKSLGVSLPPPPKDDRTWFPLPQSYGDIDTSDLRADIQRGTTQVELKLTKKG